MRRRLFLQIYVAFIGVALLCIIAAALAARAIHGAPAPLPEPVVAAAEALGEAVPTGAPEAEVERILGEWGGRLHLELGLWDADRRLMGTTSPLLPTPEQGCSRIGWFSTRAGKGVRVGLADGRWLAAMHRHPPQWAQLDKHLLLLALLLLVVAAGCYPVARRITRRLEALQDGVDQWGRGDLASRVPVQGKDEVALVAQTFNTAAERIEALVAAQRRMLSSASHELRSPLARLRMAVELLDGDDELRDGAVGDIEELDGLVGDILLSSRLESGTAQRPETPVELLQLVTAEAERAGASVVGEATTIAGDARMLKRLVRNLLDNASRHGGGGVEVALEPVAPDRVRLVVADRGPGVEESLRDRIFEPFYRPEGHAEGSDGGVGLGLALVREIAEHHGGTARCVGREGGGSRFEVELTRACPPS